MLLVVSVNLYTGCLQLGSSAKLSALFQLQQNFLNCWTPKKISSALQLTAQEASFLRLGLLPPGTRECCSRPQTIDTLLNPLLATLLTRYWLRLHAYSGHGLPVPPTIFQNSLECRGSS